jgi:hypothetical protein
MSGTRISSLLGKITVLLIICFCCLPAHAKYGGGSGTPEDPYQIRDANHMQAIGADSNDWDKHFLLMADIDLSAFTGTQFNIIGVRYYDSGWIINPFTGVFDGNDYTISNFTYTSNERDNIGLFGYVDDPNAVIKDLGLIDPNVDAGTGQVIGSLIGWLRGGTTTGCYVERGSVAGDSVVGGLVGVNTGTITNCYSAASVSGGHDIGGLVGVNQDIISNCYSTASVSGDEAVGGLVGKNYYGIISNCYSNASVSGHSTFGGLVGWNFGTISNSYSTASVSGDYRVGGLVGRNYDTITNCYSTGSVAGTGSWVGGLVGENEYGTITNCYATGSVSGYRRVGGLVGFNKIGTITNCYATGSITGYYDGIGGLVGFNENGMVWASFWDIETSGKTTSAAGTGKSTAMMQAASTFIEWQCDSVWTIDEGVDYPRLVWENKPGELITTPSFGGGSGEPNDPYLIYTAEQLNTIGSSLYPCYLVKHFLLCADIDLAGFTGTSFNIIGYYISDDDNKPFTGVFDGNGHTISNFTYAPTDTDRVGLFGYVDDPNAEIKDLGLIDPNLDAGMVFGIGSLVGWLRDGTINNCYIEGGIVSGNYYFGGLVGHNSDGTIANCYSSGDVSGTTNVGGLVGGNSGTITNCYATGSVIGNRDVGGLVGMNGSWWRAGTITNCYATGSVSGNSGVGGFVGTNYSTIIGCYSTGSVSGGNTVGGLAGKNSGTISNCYSAGSVSGNIGLGGLVGQNGFCDIFTCAPGTITNSCSTASVSGDDNVGGLVGHNRGTISNCYSQGSVEGDSYVGGLVGENERYCDPRPWMPCLYGIITNCYSTASTSGNINVGGLVGWNENAMVWASFWDIETSGQTTSVGGTGLQTAEMQTKSTFIDAAWDLVGETANGTKDIWKICEGEDYPRFSWEKYGGGCGTVENPFLIRTSCQMQAIGTEPNDWDEYFILVNDINLAKYSGEEFNVIGTGIPFTGVFDGNSHTISNFTYKETFHWHWPILDPTLDHTDQGFNTLTNINNMFSDDFIQDEPIVIPTPDDINWIPIPIPFPPSFGGDGLFASVDGVDAEIKNLTLVDPNIKTFGGSIGALVGHLHNGVVSNCGVEGGIVHKMAGGIIGLGHSHLGGLVGYISDGNVSGGYVSNCYLINQSWGGSAGGLTARNEAGTISNCCAIDSVVTDGALISGGLVTFNAGVILNSYVIGSENESGLVGTNTGTISNCHTSGSSRWAGLVCANSGTILNSYTTGTVDGNNFAGGLVSINDGEISNCYTTCAVDGNNYIGGLVGYNNDGTVSNCYATGPVTGDANVGALVGYDDGGSYVSSFWDSDVNPDANGIGNATDPNVIGKPTVEMQMESTFTDAGWDFFGETTNGTDDIWFVDEGVGYPRLWWETVPVLHAEPEVTLGTNNIISWGPLPSANEYYAECAADTNFTNILYNTGWITETSCEFTGLELGKRYWYSVKARNSAGTETGWSNVESSLQVTLTEAVDAMLDPDTLKNENLKNALLNKINAVQWMVAEGLYADALNKLQNDILAKMNGCVETGEPDKNDWIITCEGQKQIYPLIIETIEYVKSLME